MTIPETYFHHQDVLFLAEDLIGKYLFTNIEGQLCGGIITETEAYQGVTDRACHAFGGRRTARNEVMYAQGGVIYVFLCYGIHSLLNFVTNQKEVPEAILIRSILPTHGEELILRRTGKSQITSEIGQGPGRVSKALGVNTQHSGCKIPSDMIWLEDREFAIPKDEIMRTPRIGIDYAGEDALLPYRFVWEQSKFMFTKKVK